jgi:hypothetical protein
MMTIRSGLVVLLKSFVIVLCFQVALWLVGSIVAGKVPFRFLAITALIFIPLILTYWFAEAAVDAMTPKSNEVLAEPSVRFGDLQSIAFSTVGAYILFTAIRETIYLILFFWQSQVAVGLQAPPEIYINPIVSWLIGLYLLVGAPQLRRWLTSLRRAAPNIE